MEQQEEEEMEEEEMLHLEMEPLLCDSPALLPTVTLALTVEPANTASLSHTTQLSTQVCLPCLFNRNLSSTYSKNAKLVI